MAKKKRPIDQETDQKLEVSDAMVHELRQAVELREAELEKAQKYLKDRGLSTLEIEGHLELLRGAGPTRPGLKYLLGFREDSSADERQLHIEGGDGKLN